MAEPWVGIIANPVSARDIRRVIANAASSADHRPGQYRVAGARLPEGLRHPARDDDAGDRRHPRPCEARPRPLGQSGRDGIPRAVLRRHAGHGNGRGQPARRGGDVRGRGFGHRRAGRRRNPSRRGLGLREGAAGRHLHRHQQRLSRASRAHGDGAGRRPRRRRAHPGLGRLPDQQALRRLRQ